MTKYRKSWSQVLKEVREDIEVNEFGTKGIKVAKDFKYDGKVVKISKKDFSKVHKDYKNSTKGKETMLILDPKTQGTISVPVQFEEVEFDEKLGMYGGSGAKKKAVDDYDKKRKKSGDKIMSIHKNEVELEAKEPAYPATVDTLRKIVKDKQNQVVMFKSGQARVDLFTASAMVQVYDALKKPDMKKHFEKMIADKAGFMKTQAFAMKMIG